MTLGKLITRLLRPCSSAPKSPTPPTSPNADPIDAPAPEPRKDSLVEVTPCMDISNKLPSAPPSPSTDKDSAAGNQAGRANDKADVENSIANLVVEPPASPGTRPVTLTEADHDASDKLVVDVFGFEILHNLQGKAWDERGQAVQAVRARVVQGDLPRDCTVANFFHAGCSVALVALKDKVMPVFFDGVDLTKLLLGDFGVKHALAKEVLKAEVDTLVPVLVGKTSDRNARSIEGTRQALVFLARQPSVGCQQVVGHILQPFANSKDVAAIRGRLEMIGHFIGEFGLSKASTMSLSSVMGFVRPHLDATDEKVRRAAIEVTVSCYSLKGERTMKYCSNLKPALLRLLEQRFAEVDNKKNGNSKKSATQSALPDVRGTKRKPLRNGSGGGIGSRGKPLAPLEMSPSGRLPNQTDSREGTEDKLVIPHADIFAPVYNDVLSSPGITASPIISEEPQDTTAAGQQSLHEDPNYIPSPTEVPSERFRADEIDEAFMDEIEANY